MSVTLDEKQTQGSPSRRWGGVICGWPLGFLTALQFLTVTPPLVRREFTQRELGQAVGWFALVGVLLGGVLAGTDYALGLFFPARVTAVLVLVLWVLATGALHLDGFLDTCDGLFGGHTPEARLRIMRDERVGAFAVIGGVLLLLVKYSCLVALADRSIALIVTPTLARWGMVVAVVVFPYARTEGLGLGMKHHAGWPQVLVASITAAVTAIVAARWLGLVVVAMTAGLTVALGAFVLRRIPGLTGDVYGAICELLETCSVLAFVAGVRL